MTTAALTPTAPSLIRWHYAWYAAAALAVMTAAILSHDIWFLNFVHVLCGLMWTGIDLFMGFVLGPILRQVDVSVRREVAIRLTPRLLFLMPTLAVITGTSGWYLAKDLGFTALHWPDYAWVAAALVLVALMTLQGVALLLPTNLMVCLELQKSNPDAARIRRLMHGYFVMTAVQGTMQILIIVIMARFVAGI
jgi:uncharacterized membrane protein